MARLPRWIKAAEYTTLPEGVQVRLTIRRWHPGFWWWFCTTWRQNYLKRKKAREAE